MTRVEVTENLTTLVARILTDSVFAEAVRSDGKSFLGKAGYSKETIDIVTGASPQDWWMAALQYSVDVGSARDRPASIPVPDSIPEILYLEEGRSLARKCLLGSSARTSSFSKTCAKARHMASGFGDYRAVNGTQLDRVGIPVWYIKVPAKKNEPGLFCGKGLSHIRAEAGTYMEVIERCGFRFDQEKTHSGTIAEMRRICNVVDPSDLALAPPEILAPDTTIDWVSTWDMLNNETVWVPLAAAIVPYNARGNTLPLPSTSNGLASGNSIEECICHGLAEIIERDAHTRCAIETFLFPIARAMAGNIMKRGSFRANLRGESPGHLDLSTVPARCRRLINRFEKADVAISVIDMTSDLGIPVFLAMACDLRAKPHEPVSFCIGLGAHPNPETALIRALTEVAQTRVLTIMGNKSPEPGVPVATESPPLRFRPQYPFVTDGAITWDMVKGFRGRSVIENIRVMLAALRRSGLERCLVMDLSNPGHDLAVGRVIVPGTDTWAQMANQDLHIGLGKRSLLLMESLSRK